MQNLTNREIIEQINMLKRELTRRIKSKSSKKKVLEENIETDTRVVDYCLSGKRISCSLLCFYFEMKNNRVNQLYFGKQLTMLGYRRKSVRINGLVTNTWVKK